MPLEICNAKDCKGCGLCQNICPNDCISLQYDAEGFLNPIVDETKCVGCGICSEQCIANNKSYKINEACELFRAQSADNDNLLNCTSGGVFGELAKIVIEKYSGVVYGAVYGENYIVKHNRAEDFSDILAMRYSKYNQSDTSGVYRLVKQDAENGRIVLFTGTPCQIVALKQYLGKDYSNLFLMDVLCYGVMSTLVLQDYIRYVIPDEAESGHIDVCFRSKKISRKLPHFTLSVNGKNIYSEPFYESGRGIGRAFGGAVINRLSCSGCEFQDCGRYSDITVGDYTERNIKSEYNSNLVIINSEKGKKLFEQAELNKQPLIGEKRDYSLERLKNKSPVNAKREKFFSIYTQYGLNEKALLLWKEKRITIFNKIAAKVTAILKSRKKIAQR